MNHPKSAGWETGQFGAWLRNYLVTREMASRYHLYYDHGDPTHDDKVVAIKGFIGDAVTNGNRIADIDLMLATPEGEVRLLVEIEERPLSPKKLLGDLFALWLCTTVAVGGGASQHSFRLTDKTKVIIAGVVPAGGQLRAKFYKVLWPRLHDISGPPGTFPLDNVSLLLGNTLPEAVELLKQEIAKSL